MNNSLETAWKVSLIRKKSTEVHPARGGTSVERMGMILDDPLDKARNFDESR